MDYFRQAALGRSIAPEITIPITPLVAPMAAAVTKNEINCY
ncbi:hypothetical protein CWATWH8502_506 [Crocosphaera watsonii WH 8502]|uniref:Uncharacterized protein n=1 Tax=Crocosphaera watsonii WH 8502 TaxID=423474 RepID=T2IDQ1_CROWT|nr:hypothetical protein CWATWH8502_506 [Crocosphaera watsonii WH 8502]